MGRRLRLRVIRARHGSRLASAPWPHRYLEPCPRACQDTTMQDHALVLFSGGQDSTTCLAWALARYPHVETLGFAYGQRHAVELECRAPIRAAISACWPGRLGADHTINLVATLGGLGATALTADTAIAM